FNHPLLRTALIPAASLHSTARDMAVFYHMLVSGGNYAGRQYIKGETIKRATALAFEGWDHLIERQLRYALGFYVGGLAPPPGEPGPAMGHGSSLSSFGHFGNRSCMAWADHDHKLVVVFLCNRLLSMLDTRQRWTEINDQVWDIIG
ncbi:MAG: serine hydrolase, partial [Chloroflexota bacterium]